MQYKAITGIMFVLLLIGILTLTFNIQPAKASGTIYIRADGSVDPPASNITSVNNITYTFTGNIYDSIVIERDNIVVDGVGYTLQGTGSGTGIVLSGRSNVTIKNTEITTFNFGIYFSYSSNCSIVGNNITENKWGGIWLGAGLPSNNNSISGNMFINNGLVVYDSYWNVVEDNLVNGKPLVYLEGVSGFKIENSGQIILINCDNIHVENFDLSRTSIGIELWNTTNTKITGNNITENNYVGILLYSSSNNSISGNNVTNNNLDGIDLRYSSDNSISGNNITNNNLGTYFYSSSNNSIIGNSITANNQTGIHLDSSSTNSISENKIANNDDGISLYYSSNNNSISGNTITANNLEGIWLSESSDNNSISGNNIRNNYGGIYLYSSSNNTLSGNNITNNSYEGIGLFGFSDNNSISGNNITNNVSGNYMGSGIELGSSNDNIISGNTIANNNYFGISLSSSSNNSIVGNDIITNKNYGIYLYSSSNNSMVGNNITNHNYGGIWLTDFANNNSISGNNIANNRDGICLYEASEYNNIVGNTITANNEYGIYFSYASSNNSIVGNSITNNEYGIWLFSSNNTFCHNSFINNTNHAYTDGSTNIWDDGYPSGGNYWSDYTGVDANMDGIGDNSYEIDSNNIDHYPLMGMFSDFPVSWEEETYHVTSVCNSSISDFQFNETAICFNVTGENDTAGFCRICIPRALMNETYKVFVNGTEVPCSLLPCSNTTHSYVYFTYNLSTQEVIVIPEFPSYLILPLFMITTLLVVTVYIKKHSSKN